MAITIEDDVLARLLKQIAVNNTQQDVNKKRQEGSYQLYGNGKARLSYMLNKEHYRTTVDAKDEEEAIKKLNLFVEEVKSRHFLSSKGKYTKYPKNTSSIRIKSLPKSLLSYLKLYLQLNIKSLIFSII